LEEIALSLIIPTYNERENLEDLLRSITYNLKNTCTSYEIILSDDNSPDETWKLAQELTLSYPSLIVIRRFRERGLTPSVLEGMERANGKILGVMDADLQHDLSILPEMIKACEDFDLVVGSRYIDSNTVHSLSLFRTIVSRLGTFFAQILLGLKITDPLSGYFLVRREVFKKLSGEINSRGFKILLEILGRNSNLKIKEIPYSFSERKKGSTKLTEEVAIDFLSELFSLRFKKKVSSRFVRYCLTGFSGVFINLIGQSLSHSAMGIDSMNYKEGEYSLPGVSVAIGFFFSVINNFYWNNRWTFRDKRIIGKLAVFQAIFYYFLITSVGFLIQISVWRFLLELLHHSLGYAEIFTYLANFFGILTATTWNYYLSKNFMWKIE
jgi:dolichol-phosphate mannosyltransferase